MERIIASTYEGSTLVVQHVFFGETLSDAEGVLNAHLKTDAFLNASMTRKVSSEHNTYRGEWKSIPLTTVLEHETWS